MGKIRRLSMPYGTNTSILFKVGVCFTKILQQIWLLPAPDKKQAPSRTLHPSTHAPARECYLKPESIHDDLEKLSLQACAAQPTEFHDLLKLLTLEDKYKPLTFDLGEQMAKKGLTEVRYRACRLCIKITPQGINYLNALESKQL